ncbi:protein BLISTER-like isoform X1 [Gossypium raimondii]|uniref:protein BLISTER-like isoform X1 n=1 Tax=Gossypium raimondii TaxID=29730 RepID=UPI00063AF1C7|nr:protein BLISTER-like isoform X1 [Gossypium raimondii]
MLYFKMLCCLYADLHFILLCSLSGDVQIVRELVTNLLTVLFINVFSVHCLGFSNLFILILQHIEDLTQEKFSLQRALEASRTLPESLAAENSSLTDSYNQRRSIVNRLKSDMESLQEEIKAQLDGAQDVVELWPAMQ